MIQHALDGEHTRQNRTREYFRQRGGVGGVVYLGPPPLGRRLNVVPRDRLRLPTPHLLRNRLDSFGGHRYTNETLTRNKFMLLLRDRRPGSRQVCLVRVFATSGDAPRIHTVCLRLRGQVARGKVPPNILSSANILGYPPCRTGVVVCGAQRPRSSSRKVSCNRKFTSEL